MNDNNGYNDVIFFDTDDKVDDHDKIVDEQSSDNDADNILLSDLAKNEPSTTNDKKHADDTVPSTSGMLQILLL
jgi:hypothetical protein